MLLPRPLARAIEGILPAGAVARLKSVYTHYHRWTVTRLHRGLLDRLLERYPPEVRHGPFQGMQYGDDRHASQSVSKWLGVYEAELHEVVDSLCGQPFDRVINIGCAEGYYAVGLARRLSGVEMFAFDTDESARAQCRRLAQLNGVAERVTIGETCRPREIDRLILERSLVVCDCEGAELELLDPTEAPRLAAAVIVAEIHDFADPSISETLLARFSSTHWLTRLPTRERDAEVYPELKRLNQRERRLALDEFRPGPMEWFLMKPKAG